jgi:hypothetical protein
MKATAHDEVLPITPSEVIDAKAERMPPQVLAVFNALIAENWNDHRSHFTLKEVYARLPGIDSKWLNVEGIYRKAGWTVTYDQPGYCEDYEATFTFTKAKP